MLKVFLIIFTVISASLLNPVVVTEANYECPEPTSDGLYTVTGYGSNGEPMCSFNFYNECPYAEGYSIQDPMCKKLEPVDIVQPEVQANNITKASVCEQ